MHKGCMNNAANPHAAPAPAYVPAPRSYAVKEHRDFRPEARGLDWRCYMYGDGHWCTGPQYHTFRSETEAHAAGRRWVATGGER